MKRLSAITLIATAAASVIAMDAAMLARLEAHYNATKDGRAILHGAIAKQIYTNEVYTITDRNGNPKEFTKYLMIDVYADGYQYTNSASKPQIKPPATPIVTPAVTIQKEKTEWQKRMDAIAAARNAAATNITVHTEIITPGQSVKGKRVFSKLKLVLALQRIGKWDAAKQFIEDNGLWDLYNAAVNVKEDDFYFKAGLQQVKTALGLTDNDVERILSECVAE